MAMIRQSEMAQVSLCDASEVAEGTAQRVTVGDLALAVFNVAGSYYVTDDNCTHGPGSLSEGYIEGNVVECDFHQGAFDIVTGEVVAPPCKLPVKTYRALVEDGKVVIEVYPSIKPAK
jgi:nitrite reductase/ring-hydroxylating ferredoxin subunit